MGKSGMRRSILIIKCGSADRAVSGKMGDYESWLIRALGGDPSHFTVVYPAKGEALPELGRCAAVLTTGSAFAVTEHRPWMLATGDYLLRAGDAGVPVLAVGFGHQLLGEMLGASVEKSPHGREFGTVEVSLSSEGQRDPLFRSLPPVVKVFTSHEYVLAALPPGATLLASNAHTEVQAFRHGDYLYGLQFNPELWLELMRTLAEQRRLPTTHLSEEVTAGRAIMKNFYDRHIAPRVD
jgi:GMP synthase (glutamine-hydrolysing)